MTAATTTNATIAIPIANAALPRRELPVLDGCGA
jgi:hypothetical protein